MQLIESLLVKKFGSFESNLDELAGNANYLKDISLSLADLNNSLDSISTSDLDQLPHITANLKEIEKDLDQLQEVHASLISLSLKRMEEHFRCIDATLENELSETNVHLEKISETLYETKIFFARIAQDLHSFVVNPFGGPAPGL